MRAGCRILEKCITFMAALFTTSFSVRVLCKRACPGVRYKEEDVSVSTHIGLFVVSLLFQIYLLESYL